MICFLIYATFSLMDPESLKTHHKDQLYQPITPMVLSAIIIRSCDVWSIKINNQWIRSHDTNPPFQIVSVSSLEVVIIDQGIKRSLLLSPSITHGTMPCPL